MPADHMGEPGASGGAATGRWQCCHGSIVVLHFDWDSAEVGYQWRVFCLCDRDCRYILPGAAEVEKADWQLTPKNDPRNHTKLHEQELILV